MLSLSPRYDLFHFEFPKDYFPEELLDKYNRILQNNTGVIDNILDYVNESIVGVSIPGVESLNIQQEQISYNISSSNHRRIEPSHSNSYQSSENILSKINNTFTVNLRQNQGLINYFFLYETLFYRYCKPLEYNSGSDVFNIDILSENGAIISQVKLYQPIMNSIDGIEFSYNKITRDSDNFNLEFNFNNIDFEFIKTLE